MKVLVTYGSKHHSTAEIAERIGGQLRGAGYDVDVEPAGSAGSPDPYDAVVVGGAVYMARWHRDARRFLKQHRKRLAQKDLWLFSSGPVGEDDPKANADRWTRPKFVEKMAAELHAHDHAVFGGRVPQDPGNFVERAMLRDTPAEVQDRRDWQEIDNWAKTIGDLIGG
jgi:menaquinone-dependent protoporphyrinogen oxidase